MSLDSELKIKCAIEGESNVASGLSNVAGNTRALSGELRTASREMGTFRAAMHAAGSLARGDFAGAMSGAQHAIMQFARSMSGMGAAAAGFSAAGLVIATAVSLIAKSIEAAEDRALKFQESLNKGFSGGVQRLKHAAGWDRTLAEEYGERYGEAENLEDRKSILSEVEAKAQQRRADAQGYRIQSVSAENYGSSMMAVNEESAEKALNRSATLQTESNEAMADALELEKMANKERAKIAKELAKEADRKMDEAVAANQRDTAAAAVINRKVAAQEEKSRIDAMSPKEQAAYFESKQKSFLYLADHPESVNFENGEGAKTYSARMKEQAGEAGEHAKKIKDEINKKDMDDAKRIEEEHRRALRESSEFAFSQRPLDQQILAIKQEIGILDKQGTDEAIIQSTKLKEKLTHLEREQALITARNEKEKTHSDHLGGHGASHRQPGHFTIGGSAAGGGAGKHSYMGESGFSFGHAGDHFGDKGKPANTRHLGESLKDYNLRMAAAKTDGNKGGAAGMIAEQKITNKLLGDNLKNGGVK